MPNFSFVSIPSWDQTKTASKEKLDKAWATTKPGLDKAWTTTKPGLEKAYTTAKPGFDKAYAVIDKLAVPVNNFSNRLGSEAFWPTTLDKESDKAARILRSFCKDGFYTDDKAMESLKAPNSPKDANIPRPPNSPRGKQRVIQKIPSKVIHDAKGLAIFTTCRTGFWVSGASGSGILVGRKQNGEWSPPSGILLHTAGLGFLVGIDIYDCVIVINTAEALQAFTKLRCTIGGEVSAVAGPVGVGGILESEIHKRQAPVWNYLKSRGFYAGVQMDGTIIIERTDENERFYGERIGVADILRGNVRNLPAETKGLLETIRMAQGDRDIDEKALPESSITLGDSEVQYVDGKHLVVSDPKAPHDAEPTERKDGDKNVPDPDPNLTPEDAELIRKMGEMNKQVP